MSKAGITDNINSNTTAVINPGSVVSAGHDLTVEALTSNDALGTVDGTAIGLGSAGSTDATVNMANQTRATTADTFNTNPVVLAAGTQILFFTNTFDNGNITVRASGGGGLSLGGTDLFMQLLAPVTESYLGNWTMVNAPSAALLIEAQNQNNLSSTLSEQTIAGIASNVGSGNAIVGGSQTIAAVGSDATVQVAQFELSAVDANLQADCGAKTEADGGGASDDATAVADEETTAECTSAAIRTLRRLARWTLSPTHRTFPPMPTPKRPSSPAPPFTTPLRSVKRM